MSQTTIKDKHGLPITTNSQEVIDCINEFFHRFLGLKNTMMDPLQKASELDPTCVYVVSLLATLYLYAEDPSIKCLADLKLDDASFQSNLAHCTERERRFYQALVSWSEGDNDVAAKELHSVVDQWPQDIFSAKVCQDFYFNMGRAVEMLDVGRKVYAAVGQQFPLVTGMLAFPLEQNGHFQEAEDLARRGIELERDNPWLHHALAHTLDSQGKIHDIVAVMEAVKDTWGNCVSFMSTHNYWHLGLAYLDLEQVDKVLQLYDEYMWGIDKNCPQDQIGAICMLWRIEMRGHSVGGRWEDVCSYVEKRTQDRIYPYLDLHYVYALCRGGRSDMAEQMIKTMGDDANTAKPFRRGTLEKAAAFARGLKHHADGEYNKAYDVMKDHVDKLASFGGSTAQRDVFVQAFLHAMLKASMWSEAQSLVEGRAKTKPMTVAALNDLAILRRGMGNGGEAESLEEKIRVIRSSYAAA